MHKPGAHLLQTAARSTVTALMIASLGMSFAAPAFSAQVPHGGTPSVIPGKIEAENFDLGGPGVAFSDTTPGNAGGYYRNEGVDIWLTSDAGGGYMVGTTAAGEWMEYTVNVAATGSYLLKLRAASVGGKSVSILMNDQAIADTVAITDTGGWQIWKTFSVPVFLNAGQQVLRLKINKGSVNINFVEFVSPTAQTPFGGAPWAIPGVIEAENYDLGGADAAYHDTTDGNAGGQYRNDNADLWVSGDSGDGYMVGTTVAGEWLEYTVHVATTGSYVLNLRAASAVNGKSVSIQMDGKDVSGPIAINSTGGWQTWKTFTVPVFLSAGQQVMRLKIDKGSVNINRIDLDRGAEAPAWPGVAVLANDPKTLVFRWSEVPGATSYRLMKDPDGVSGFTQVGDDLTTTATTDYISVHLHDWASARYLVEACNSTGCESSSVVNTASAMLAAIGYFKASNTNANDTFGWIVALSGDGNTMAVGAPEEDSAATGIDGNQANNGATNAGAVYVFTRTGGGWVQQAYLKASNAQAGDRFGRSIALSADGNTLAVGAPYESSYFTFDNPDQANNSAPGAGAVYVFNRSGSSGGTFWAQQSYVKSNHPDPESHYGWSVALSADGNTLAVGAKDEFSVSFSDSNGNVLSGVGHVYIYARIGAIWSVQGSLIGINPLTNDNFGEHIALSGDGKTLAVSAKEVDEAGGVYIFASNNTSDPWYFGRYTFVNGGIPGDKFGASLTLSSDGNTLAVGRPGEDSKATGINGNEEDNSALESGAVVILMRTGGAWRLGDYIKASNTDAGDAFGTSVALSADGNSLAVGAPGEDSLALGVINGNQLDNSGMNGGAAYFYNRTDGTWRQTRYIKASNHTGTSFAFGAGITLSADGATLAVGAPGEDNSANGINGNQQAPAGNIAPAAGAVYLY